MKPQAGFTLLEVLVALAVLAIAMGAIISAATQSINTVALLREQTFAGWVALNQIQALQLEPEPWPEQGVRAGKAELANRAWRWEARFYSTADPDLRRLELTVRADESGQELTQRIAFRGKPPEKPADPTGQPAGTATTPQPRNPAPKPANPQPPS